MREKLFFLFLALALHAVLFFFMPQVFIANEQRLETVVYFEPMERKILPVDTSPSNVTPQVESKPKPVVAAKPAEAKPKPKPTKQETVSNQVKSEPTEVVAGKAEVLPERGEVEFISAEIPAIVPEDMAVTVEIDDAADSETENADAAELIAEEPDGKVEEVVTVQTSIGERIQYDLTFTGVGRKFREAPTKLGDFKLSNNTTVTVLFKIDKSGRTFDIEIPPVPREVEIMLRDFVRNVKFSAVLYDEFDSAEIKITLRVR